MRRIPSVLLLLVAVAVPQLLAQQPAHVHPAGPTSLTPIEIHFMSPCDIGGHDATRVGNVIKVRLRDVSCMITLPILQPYVATVPELLPPGVYRAEVLQEETDGVLAATPEFVVRNAGPKPFEIRPFAVRTEPAGLKLRIDELECRAEDCESAEVYIDGQRVQPVTRTQDNALWVEAPPHAKGLVDVRVRVAGQDLLSPGALYYFNEPDPSVFEQILFPVLFHVSGAFGSNWVSEAVVSNPREWFVENANTIESIACITYPCGERLEPGLVKRINGEGFPRGIALLAPRPEADFLAFSLRVRDTSKEQQSLGTHIPVVREKEMIHARPITLLDVPADPRYRVKLRVYAMEPQLIDGPNGGLYLTTVRNGVRSNNAFHRMTEACTGALCAQTPMYAEIDLPPGAEGERVDLYIEVDGHANTWAFATVTNNETHQVTIVTPSGSGGRPCEVCRVP